MTNNSYLFTSESVNEGHPDKVCDQISDGVLDAIYKNDPYGRVACETMVTTGLVVVAGEITTSTYVDIPKVARETIKKIGYTDPSFGFHYQNCAVITTIDEQSPDISIGVTKGKGLHKEQGAGDQGLMFGYATNETRSYMPLPIDLAHKISARLAQARRSKVLPYLRPDGKCQVTVEYKNSKPIRVHTVVVSNQHHPDISYTKLKKGIIEHVVKPICKDWLDSKTIYHINPTGRFVFGGPQADTGLTGRKIIVDTYGGHGSHGGGAFSGKDPSKVDRSASYAARHVAKNIVAAGLATQCEFQVAYAIGVAEPVSLLINTFGTGKLQDTDIVQLVQSNFTLTPEGIIRFHNLRRPIYQKTAAYGHFGRPGFPWEKLNKVTQLKKEAKKYFKKQKTVHV